jgi:hypothetical protein
MATHIKEILNKFLNKEEEIKNKKHIEKIVEEVLGNKIKNQFFLKKISKTKLIFSSQIPTFRFEFNLKKKEILKKIKKEIPQINEIKIIS